MMMMQLFSQHYRVKAQWTDEYEAKNVYYTVPDVLVENRLTTLVVSGTFLAAISNPLSCSFRFLTRSM